MTKTKVGVEVTKQEEAQMPLPPVGYPSLPPIGQPPQTTTVVMPPQQQFDHSGSVCWYVFGILSTIFCCLPCGVIGLVHAMIAKHEAERGNVKAHRQRLHQAKCWTSWSIALGLLVLIAMAVAAGLTYKRMHGEMKFGRSFGELEGSNTKNWDNDVFKAKGDDDDDDDEGWKHGGKHGRKGGKDHDWDDDKDDKDDYTPSPIPYHRFYGRYGTGSPSPRSHPTPRPYASPSFSPTYIYKKK